MAAPAGRCCAALRAGCCREAGLAGGQEAGMGNGGICGPGGILGGELGLGCWYVAARDSCCAGCQADPC